MKLAKTKQIVADCLADPSVIRLYADADKSTKGQTHHGLDHAYEVLDLAKVITADLHARHPAMLDDWTRSVVVPLAAFLHDIGRGIAEHGHAKTGAKWAVTNLPRYQVDGERLPSEHIKRIARVIAKHQSKTVLSMDFNDPAWAIIVLADKCVGDEGRVRFWKRVLLRTFTALGVPWLPLRQHGAEHDRVNFAIKSAILRLEESTGRFVLDVTMDRRVCGPELVLEVFKDRYKACRKAALYLGYEFVVSFKDR